MKGEKLIFELITSLRNRGNGAHRYFETLVAESKTESMAKEARQKLISCFSITQYAEFTPEEEELLRQIIKKNVHDETE